MPFFDNRFNAGSAENGDWNNDADGDIRIKAGNENCEDGKEAYDRVAGGKEFANGSKYTNKYDDDIREAKERREINTIVSETEREERCVGSRDVVDDVLEAKVLHPGELAEGFVVADTANDEWREDDNERADTNDELVEFELLQSKAKMWVEDACKRDAGGYVAKMWRVERQCERHYEANHEQRMRMIVADNLGTKPEQEREPEYEHDDWRAGGGEE